MAIVRRIKTKDNMANLIELLPIILGIIAIIINSLSVVNYRRKSDRIRSVLSILASILLIIAQTSWYVSNIIMGLPYDISWADNIWTVFNTLVMIIFIAFPGIRLLRNRNDHN